MFGLGKVTRGLPYSGDFNGKSVSQLVWHFPLAVVAFAARFAVAVLVEADSRVYWAVFPAILYGVFAFLGRHWALPPDFLDRVGQTLSALFPALTCVMGAWVAARRFPPNVGGESWLVAKPIKFPRVKSTRRWPSRSNRLEGGGLTCPLGPAPPLEQVP